jgi:hypothetical protein
MVIDARFMDREIRDSLGAVPSRTVPLSISYPYSEELSIRIQLPEPYRFTETIEEMQVDTPPLAYSWSILSGGRGQSSLEMVRRTDLSVSRVSPHDYPALLESLLQVDQAEALHLVAEP